MGTNSQRLSGDYCYALKPAGRRARTPMRREGPTSPAREGNERPRRASPIDRSPVDVLLYGSHWSCEPSTVLDIYNGGSREVLDARKRGENIRIDPNALTLMTVAKGSDDYQRFTQQRRVVVPVRAVPYKERLPRWLPAKLKWMLEERISGFLGEIEPQAHTVRVELSFPHSHSLPLAVGSVVLPLVSAWLFRTPVSMEASMMGIVTGMFFGIMLRMRLENERPQSTFSTLWITAQLLLLAVVLSSGPSLPSSVGPLSPLLRGLPRPAIRAIRLSEVVVYLALTLGPFVYDPRSEVLENNAVLWAMLAGLVVFSRNPFPPLGAWLGGLIRVVREQIAPPAAATAATDATTALASGRSTPAGVPAPAAGAATARQPWPASPQPFPPQAGVSTGGGLLPQQQTTQQQRPRIPPPPPKRFIPNPSPYELEQTFGSERLFHRPTRYGDRGYVAGISSTPVVGDSMGLRRRGMGAGRYGQPDSSAGGSKGGEGDESPPPAGPPPISYDLQGRRRSRQGLAKQYEVLDPNRDW